MIAGGIEGGGHCRLVLRHTTAGGLEQTPSPRCFGAVSAERGMLMVRLYSRLQGVVVRGNRALVRGHEARSQGQAWVAGVKDAGIGDGEGWSDGSRSVV